MVRPWTALRLTPVAKDLRLGREHSEEVSRLGFVHAESHRNTGKLVAEADKGRPSKGGLGFYNCKFSRLVLSNAIT